MSTTTCPKCAGTGQFHRGGICYRCGGTGIPVVRSVSAAQQADLDARAAGKDAEVEAKLTEMAVRYPTQFALIPVDALDRFRKSVRYGLTVDQMAVNADAMWGVSV